MEPLLTIYNNHTANCGQPPTVDNSEGGNYYGYFQNKYGEQWLFVYDRETQKGTLRSGDAGWGTIYHVIDGRVPDLLLDADERQWFSACWNAATGIESRCRE